MRSILIVALFLISSSGVNAEENVKGQKRAPNQAYPYPVIEGEYQLKPGQSMVYCVKGSDADQTVMTLNTSLVAEGFGWKSLNAQGRMVDVGVAKPFAVSAPSINFVKGGTFHVCVTITKQ